MAHTKKVKARTACFEIPYLNEVANLCGVLYALMPKHHIDIHTTRLG